MTVAQPSAPTSCPINHHDRNGCTCHFSEQAESVPSFCDVCNEAPLLCSIVFLVQDSSDFLLVLYRGFIEPLKNPVTNSETSTTREIYIFSEASKIGGFFSLRLTFTDNYPENPARVRFTSDIFRPNVYHDGTLCMDIIQDAWSPCHNVVTILTSIQANAVYNV